MPRTTTRKKQDSTAPIAFEARLWAAEGANPEDPDEYRAAHIFWVPKEARWAHIRASAPQPAIGTIVQ